MTYAVDAIEGVRDAANARASKLPEKDPLRKQLQELWPPSATSCARRSWPPKKAA